MDTLPLKQKFPFVIYVIGRKDPLTIDSRRKPLSLHGRGENSKYLPDIENVYQNHFGAGKPSQKSADE